MHRACVKMTSRVGKHEISYTSVSRAMRVLKLRRGSKKLSVVLLVFVSLFSLIITLSGPTLDTGEFDQAFCFRVVEFK